MKKPSHLMVRLSLSAFIMMLIAGCSTVGMKGTPFYTGEYTKRQGPAEERINLWPAMYYRDPALSILWPIAEKTDDHFALRPLMSVYNLDKEKHVYNVLWPIARFDPAKKDYRIFPVFWGKGYFFVVPAYGRLDFFGKKLTTAGMLYWNYGKPFTEKDGCNTLFPLWVYSRNKRGYDLFAPWPLARTKKNSHERDWYVFPVAGSFKRLSNGDFYRYQAWPLAHQWSDNAGKVKGSAVAPLYFYEKCKSRKTFISLPYSGEWKDNGDSWSLLFPAYYSTKSKLKNSHSVTTLLGHYSKSDIATTWVAVPLLSGSKKTPEGYDTWIGGPLAHFAKDKESSMSHIFPLYFNHSTDDYSRFLSLPWCSQTNSDGSLWQTVPMVYFMSRDTDGSKLQTLLFYWHKEKKTFISPAYSQWEASAGQKISLIPPLLTMTSKQKEDNHLYTLGGAAHFSWGDKAETSHVLPIYYANRKTGTVLTPLASKFESPQKTSYIFPPALSWKTKSKTEDRSDLWIAGPIAHMSWGKDAGSRHVLPLFYSDPSKQKTISPLYCSWKDRSAKKTFIPPLLAGSKKRSSYTDVYAAAGIFRNKFADNPKRREGHLLPLYAYDHNTLLTPVYGHDKGSNGFVYPATPLFGWRTGRYSGSWLFPLYSHRKTESNGNIKNRYLLLGSYKKYGRTSRSSFPLLYTYRHTRPQDPEKVGNRYSRSGKTAWIFPTFSYRNEKIIPRRNLSIKQKSNNLYSTPYNVKRNSLFPLWDYSSTEWPEKESKKTEGKFLMALYDYKHQLIETDKGMNDYKRSRVLWRLWHYEKENGDVTVDIFPAITYDKKVNGFKKISFLWRLFRYEKNEKSKKLDLLFIPIMRKSA